MIGYVTLGCSDRARASAFYDALLALFGAKQLFSNDHMSFWGRTMGEPVLGVGDPYDKQSASNGNGTMVALSADSTKMVDEVYAKAIELGASDEGAPGPRGEGFYGGYFRDFDGNKFVVFVMQT